MKLRRLYLHGFKSFADRTELLFHDGITAIVGPNGCGKSNISDAIRWVLGEQRASAIRSSKMEEAIFQGTTERRAVNRAEVALAFSNEHGRLPLPYPEIDIRRTVFREGGSDYQLNRSPCRLRDIFDLCRDTGLGANAYAVIEQGMVDAILSDRPEERRHLFEEAAGIGRYKDRRKGAQRRLEAAETDLARLEDLISEVDSKVRSLARQRRKAQRYQELRARRLALEVAVAADELRELESLLSATARELETLGRDEPAARAALSTLEVELERRRIEVAQLVRARSESAPRLEEVARQIAEREREVAVADERRVHATTRLTQIAAERQELRRRTATLEEERSLLEARHAEQRTVVQALEERLRVVQERQLALRQELADARRADEAARAHAQELSGQVARLELEAVGGEGRVAELEARLPRLDAEEEELRRELLRLEAQGDLFVQHGRELAAARAALESERKVLAQRLEEARSREAEARRAQIDAEDRIAVLTGRHTALAALEREYHGFAPAVAAALAARGRLRGLNGPLAEFLELPAERGALVEDALHSLLQVIVVEGPAAAGAVRAWLAAEQEGGVLALLPAESLPKVHALLEALEFAGQPAGEPVLLGRRERLARLEAEASEAVRERDARAAERAARAAEVADAETALRALDARSHGLDAELRRADADETTRATLRGRAERSQGDIEQKRIELRAALERARQAAEAARSARVRLETGLDAHRDAWREAGETLKRRERAWEEIRDQESDLRIEHVRAASALEELDRRLEAGRASLDDTARRVRGLDREEAENRQSLERLEGVRSGAGVDLEERFRSRDELAASLRAIDERLGEANTACEALESDVRSVRRTADERGEARHRLELRRAEAEAGTQRVRDRLEAEWGRAYELLVREAEPAEGDPAALRAELQAMAADIAQLGPINMLAIEEHDEESQRLAFLDTQRQDLASARDDLQSAIRQINRTARQLFADTFEQIRVNFRRTFETLFEGGECELWLEDDEDPLESGIEISASPRGKRTQRIHLLSGGERALTALALLFAIYLVKPSPFCVLDEVDAPLDEANIGRFVAMLQEFKRETQFIVITHNPRTMEAADWIYGVTMEEPGVSSIVGVKIEEQLAGTPAA